MTAPHGDRGDKLGAYAGCPLLLVEQEAWRRGHPAAENRCHGVRPAVRVDGRKQRDLCLVADHLGCQTYRAATGVDAGSLPRATPSRWGHTSSRATLRDRNGLGTRLRGVSSRSLAQAVLAVLFAGSLIALGSGRLPSLFAGGAGGSSPSSPVSSSPIPSPPASPTPSTEAATLFVATPSPPPATIPPSGAPSPSPEASSGPTTYVVRSGDTLYSIAARFSTTVSAIQTLNGITDPSHIRPGQVLQIP